MSGHASDGSSPAPEPDNWRWVVRGCAGLGAVVAAWAFYGFGIEVSGVLLGVVAAINGVIFGALMAGTLADSLITRFVRTGIKDARKQPVR